MKCVKKHYTLTPALGSGVLLRSYTYIPVGVYLRERVFDCGVLIYVDVSRREKMLIWVPSALRLIPSPSGRRLG